MKKLLTSAAMLLCSLLTFAQFSGSGSGTENDPYLILNPIQLNQMRNFLNKSGVYFKLMADIDLTEFTEDEYGSRGWLPIGTESMPFMGILDGNGKSLSGLIINRDKTDHIGLFAYIQGATIKNLTVKNANIIGMNKVGTLVGSCIRSSSTVVDCTISGNVYGKTDVGGCVGFCFGGATVDMSNIISTVTVIGENNTGGIIGTHYNSNISNCKVYADISGLDYTGGICGCKKAYYSKSTTCCTFIGNVSGQSYVGGIYGFSESWSGPTSKCFVAAHIFGTGDYIGGLIGYSESNDTNNSYFSGTVVGGQEVGGIIGHLEGSGMITLCYTSSSVSGNKYVGGICGKVNGRPEHVATLEKNVSYVNSVKVTDSYVGRIYGGGSGFKNGSPSNNKAYNKAIVINAGIVQDIVDDKQNGDGVSATTLKLKATYVAMGWDFTEIWTIQETECLPYFKWQTAPPVLTSQVVSGSTVVSGKCIDGGTITLEVDGVKQQMVSTGNTFSFTVSPLQAGHEVRVSAKADDKEQSYYTTAIVEYLGKGTEADPYQVYTASDLTGVYRKGYFKLMNDIDLTSYINQFSPTEGWESIGREGSETIHFDGDGHKITGLWCNSTRDNTGLFSCFANGTIKNLTVETAKDKQMKGGANTGILIGKMINGTIENCTVSGSVADGTPVGGMVGLFDGGNISLCKAIVTINTTESKSYVGGLVGETTGGRIDQCVTTGALKGIGTESYVGGLVGKNSATVTNCYSTADVTSSYNASGLVAYNYGVVDKCYALGNLFSNNYAAGVIGYNDGVNAVVKNCAAMNNKIDITYESQQVQQGVGYGQRIIGGIKNSAPAPEMNNYALKTMQVSVNDVPQRVYDDIMNGVAKTQAELTQQTTYTGLGWDFANVWNINGGYPYLKKVKPIAGSEITKGDLNGDGTIDILDIILIIDVMTGELTDAQKKAAADVNCNGNVDILDIIGAIDLMILQNNVGSRRDKMSTNTVVGDFITALMQNGEVMVSLNNQNRYTAFQMVVNVPKGVSINDAKMNGIRGNNHQIILRRLNERQYLLMGFSADKRELTGNDGQIFSLTTEGQSENEIIFSDVQFATTNAEAFRLSPVSIGNATTGIQEISEQQQVGQAYDLLGRKVNGQLKKGLYIVNGKKINQK